jgi:hypothetical protein
MGMDYVVENKELEINFNQLGEAYNGLGDFKKKIYFSQKQIIKKEKKMKIYVVLLRL